MESSSNLQTIGRYGRLTRIAAVVCLLVACVLLLVSLAVPIGSASSKLPVSALMLNSA